MKILAQTEKSDIATVYLAETVKGKYIEFVESVQPPIPREKKWVLLISTLYGCPVSCAFCDCGYYYDGKLNKEDILSQIDFLVSKRYPDKKIPVEKFKIQFARIGEPALNNHVLEVLDTLAEIYEAPGLLPSISTIAPANTEDFFEELLIIKKTKYPTRFQMQFSIHTTDEIQRDKIIPVKKWG
ncbi:radical SAM protein, partial [Bacteroidota bacterium]